MNKNSIKVKLSVVIPCYNEENTLEKCVERVLKIANDSLSLDIIIVDDMSTDNSREIALELLSKYQEISFYSHEKNKGKGAALKTGFSHAKGDFVAVQDADLEYNPTDLIRLLEPLIDGRADVVLGSRFLSSGIHRVLYFWHSLGNKFLTLLSNFFTDLNLTDMETCYKVFRREIIQSIDIKENRFGFEPEIVAKISQMNLRIYEMGISYDGRTYDEGKKIGYKDGLRALYCIFHYNAHKAPLPIQIIIYAFIGGISALINYMLFMLMYNMGVNVKIAIPTAFGAAAILNYILSILILFRHKARWNAPTELFIYIIFVFIIGVFDFSITSYLLEADRTPSSSKIMATIIMFFINFIGRRFLIFSEK